MKMFEIIIFKIFILLFYYFYTKKKERKRQEIKSVCPNMAQFLCFT